MKKALITGISGQDGSYLAELLLEKGYEVHGVLRESSVHNTARIDRLIGDSRLDGGRLLLHRGDLADALNLMKILTRVEPDEIYHLAAQSHVRQSFDIPEPASDITALGTIRLLEAMREIQPKTKFFHASSASIFGNTRDVPQRDTTPVHPRSPHAVAKAYAHWATINYRESYNLFACNGILFNHESPRRGELFVSRKITCAVARIKAGLQDSLYLGNLDAERDWGYAKEYVEAMWLMLQQEEPDDVVIATGEAHPVHEFLGEAFSYAGLDWHELVEVDPGLCRPAETERLIGDTEKARKKLGWSARTGFKELVRLMVDADTELLENSPPAALR